MNRLDTSEIVDGAAPTKRLFTAAEATRALVLVRRILRDVVTGYSRLLDLHERVEAADDGDAHDCSPDKAEMVRLVEQLQECMEEFDQIGVELKEWTTGIVDFPSVVDGREVCLCWQMGERTVRHWHEADASCACREPIRTLTALKKIAV
ncbi:MAG TPA: hypothetical protein DCX07_02980 [Phycisphaerales bacterium]|nr:hypothetical protein [Phycisphaerales bacterium]